MFAVRYFCFVALTFSLTAELIYHETKDSKSGITNESLKKRNSKWNFEQPTVFASHEDTKSGSRVISLYSRTGKFLEILPSGRMRGTSYRESKDSKFLYFHLFLAVLLNLCYLTVLMISQTVLCTLHSKKTAPNILNSTDNHPQY